LSAIIKRNMLSFLHPAGEYVIESENKGSDRPHKTRMSPREEASNILAQAQQTAAEIVDKAQLEADDVHIAAYHKGYNTGYREMQEERAAFSKRVAEIEADIDERVDTAWAGLEPEILKLALEIANKVVHREISESEDFVIQTIKSSLYQLRERQDLKIRVNPSDYDLVREHKDDISSACDGVRHLEVIEDRRVDQGGCIIETAGGQLDARIDTQLQEVERALMEAAHDGRNQIAA